MTHSPATCTVSSSTGKCGLPAVWSNGDFAECERHAADIGSLAGTRNAVHASNRTTTVRLKVRGIDLATRTQRRYLMVAVRPEAVQTDQGVYVAFAEVQKRSDNLDTVRDAARKAGWHRGPGMAYVVVDTVTGAEVASF